MARNMPPTFFPELAQHVKMVLSSALTLWSRQQSGALAPRAYPAARRTVAEAWKIAVWVVVVVVVCSEVQGACYHCLRQCARGSLAELVPAQSQPSACALPLWTMQIYTTTETSCKVHVMF